MNLNEFAEKITLMEGKHKSVSIAQVKEILRLVFSELQSWSLVEVSDLMKRVKIKG